MVSGNRLEMSSLYLNQTIKPYMVYDDVVTPRHFLAKPSLNFVAKLLGLVIVFLDACSAAQADFNFAVRLFRLLSLSFHLDDRLSLGRCLVVYR